MKISLTFFILLVITNSAVAQELYQMKPAAQSRVSSPENPNGIKGSGAQANASAKGSAFIQLKAGESRALLDVNTAGIIQRIWITINNRSPEVLRSLRLRMYWDGENNPAVDVPFGDFFCAALGKPVAFQSALFSNPEGRSFNCYIPMPFKKGAKVVLVNETGIDLSLIFFDIDFLQLEKPEEDMLYFHARWHRQKSSAIGQDVEILPEITGRGRFIGTSIGVNVNPVYGESWWGEGEVKMFIDGDKKFPTIVGTGAEDYIGSGWSEGFFANAYQGCLLADAQHNQYAFYRFHVPDGIYFYKNFRVSIQQIGGFMAPVVKDLLSKGVPIKPISLVDAKGQFVGLLDPKTPPNRLNDATKDDWVNFYRSDDYSVMAYYYLDRPE